MIVAAHVSEPGGQPEDLAIETVMRNFGGIATSRLNRNLRLDKHWSYGTQGVLQDARGQRPFIVIAPVQTDKTKESMLEVAKELRGVAGERPVRGEEFASIMRKQTLGLPGPLRHAGVARERRAADRQLRLPRRLLLDLREARARADASRTSPTPRRSSSGPTRRSG